MQGAQARTYALIVGAYSHTPKTFTATHGPPDRIVPLRWLGSADPGLFELRWRQSSRAVKREKVTLKVLVLGAGASKSADYAPLAGELMTTIEQHVRESRNAQPARSLGQVEGIEATSALELRLLPKDPESRKCTLDLYAPLHHGSLRAAFREERGSQVVSEPSRIPEFRPGGSLGSAI